MDNFDPIPNLWMQLSFTLGPIKLDLLHRVRTGSAQGPNVAQGFCTGSAQGDPAQTLRRPCAPVRTLCGPCADPVRHIIWQDFL